MSSISALYFQNEVKTDLVITILKYKVNIVMKSILNFE